jgi:hypothetical protein
MPNLMMSGVSCAGQEGGSAIPHEIRRKNNTLPADLVSIPHIVLPPRLAIVGVCCSVMMPDYRRFHALLSIDGLRFFAGKKEAGEKSAPFRPCHLALRVLTKKRSWTILPQFRSRHHKIIGVLLLFLTLAKGSPWTSSSKKA